VRARDALSLALAVVTLDACGEPSKGISRRKTVVEQNDSVLVVRWARRALGDSLRLRVDAITKGSEGWLVRLVPEKGGTAGGGEVWVERDSSATVVKRY
jgi:hypothetical protein